MTPTELISGKLGECLTKYLGEEKKKAERNNEFKINTSNWCQGDFLESYRN